LLLGQDVATAGGRPSLDREAWNALRSRRAGHLSGALSHREALHALREQPEFLDDLVHGADSWCVELGLAIGS